MPAVGNGRAVARRVRLALAVIVLTQAVAAGVTGGVLVSIICGTIAGCVAGVVIAAVLVWRSRTVWSLERAALWVEARDATLQYALVTAVDPRYPAYHGRGYSGALLRRAAVRALAPAIVAVGLAFGARSVAARYFGEHRGTRSVVARTSKSQRAASRLTPLTAHVAPPAYSHLSSREVKEPGSIASLVGTVVTLRGRGDTVGLRAAIGDRSVPVAMDGDRWRLDVTMPEAAAVVTLTDREYRRLVVLAPIPDAPPVVELIAPTRDSTMRQATGTLPLRARASDDIGLAEGYFEVIVTSGEEETGGVKANAIAIGRVAWHDERAATLDGGLSFEALHLKPGDVVSIRAVARDGNTVSGPGVGTSETRTFRLATKEEYDSVAVEGALPAALDSSYMSQRLIVMATQDLLKRIRQQPKLSRDTVVAVSVHLATRQDKLKNKVYQLLFGGGGGSDPQGEAMSVKEHTLFDTAYHAMTDAAMSLAVAEAKEALPREMVALAALDTVRKMQRRLYLRGQPPPIVVNIARVRMTGTEQPEAGARAPALPTDTLSRRLAAELATLGAGALRESEGAADSLVLMQVAAYGVNPALAAALGEAVSALNAGHDAKPALERARRMLEGHVAVDTTQTVWQGTP